MKPRVLKVLMIMIVVMVPTQNCYSGVWYPGLKRDSMTQQDKAWFS